MKTKLGAMLHRRFQKIVELINIWETKTMTKFLSKLDQPHSSLDQLLWSNVDVSVG
jgi:hypothetical protein